MAGEVDYLNHALSWHVLNPPLLKRLMSKLIIGEMADERHTSAFEVGTQDSYG